jgi:hypothetical protein
VSGPTNLKRVDVIHCLNSSNKVGEISYRGKALKTESSQFDYPRFYQKTDLEPIDEIVHRIEVGLHAARKTHLADPFFQRAEIHPNLHRS